MSGSQSGVYLSVKGKKLVTILETMFSAKSMKEFFQIDKEYMIIDLENYRGQDCALRIEELSESCDFIQACQRLYELVYEMNKEYVEKNQEAVKKAIESVKEIDWRCFNSCFEPWDLDLPEDMEDEDIGGAYSFWRFVYDSKKKKCGYSFESEYLPNGEFVEMKDFLCDCEEMQVFLKKNSSKTDNKTALKSLEGDYVSEIVAMSNGSQVTVIIRIKPEEHFWAETKANIEGQDWYFLLECYDTVYWSACSESAINVENRRVGNHFEYVDEDKGFYERTECLFNIEVAEYLKDHVIFSRDKTDYHDEQYQIAKEALIKVAKEYKTKMFA
ncbi:hypothetical protein [Butyrivibrio sp. WCD2001]|uniref:hypothetical protein n=1 Tax=Butyrivibrio sp. WCD2001 TaxID=1280681 RepID=UPI00040631B1|nr:hypothetical protein [Butyrivibrio sp. WCD2001]